MGKEVDGINITKADFESRYNSTIWFLLKAGEIGKIEGFEDILKDPRVFHISKRFNVGDIVQSSITGTEAQVLARVYLSCNTKEDLKSKILEIQDIIKVFDIDNNNQLLKGFNVN
jgi:hypothetical protein